MKNASKANFNLKLSDTSRIVSITDVKDVMTPAPQAKWTPVPHHVLVNEVINRIFDENFTISNTMHSLSHAGMRYFGMLEVRSKAYKPDYSWVVGILNSHDKKNAAEIIAGMRVLTTGAIVFTDDIGLSQRHNRDILKNLTQMVDDAVSELHERWTVMDKRIESYKECHLSDPDAHHVIVRSMDKRIITATQIPRVLRYYRKPLDHSLRARTAWSLFNAISITLQQIRVRMLINHTVKLTGMFDSFCKFDCDGEKFIQTDFTQDQPLVNEAV